MSSGDYDYDTTLFYLKTHLFATLAATALAARLCHWQHVPFFPIEISRTIASGPVTVGVFRIGIYSLGVWLLMAMPAPEVIPWTVWGLYVGLSTVATFPDNVHLLLHCLGVLIVFVSSLGQVVLSDQPQQQQQQQQQWIILGTAIFIMGIRWPMRAMAIVFADRANGLPPFVLTDLSRLIQWGKALYERNHALLFTVGAITPNNDPTTLLLFAYGLGGVMQWLSFFLLTLLF